MEEITITVTRGPSPVLVTGDPIVVDAVLGALDRALRGPERARVLRLARELDGAPGGPEGVVDD